VDIPSYDEENKRADKIIEDFYNFDFYWVSQLLKKSENCERELNYWEVKKLKEKIISTYGVALDIDNEIGRLANLSNKIYEEYVYIKESFDKNIVFTEKKQEKNNKYSQNWSNH